MAQNRDEELRHLAEEGAAIGIEAGGNPAQMASQLAGMQAAAMGADLASRYSQIGARWLADPVPTKLDRALVDKLTRLGFRKESLHEVRIHRGTRAQAAADALGARAFAIGDQDVFFGHGEFDPHTRTGRAVLAHELAHVTAPTAGGGGAGTGGIPAGFASGALLNQARRGDEDSSEVAQSEERSRAVERNAYAMEDTNGDATRAMPEGPPGQAQAEIENKNAKMDAKKLEDKVISLLAKWEVTEIERSGAF
ncbi:MAG: DUF4157 domain-containing protein [Myxococcales bacterium]|nr:DUF4157 domain-containing protein [Myxococcales bacterium]